MKTALLIIDIQNDYFPGGRMVLPGAEEAATRARAVLEAFRSAGAPVIHVRHTTLRPDARFFLPDTEGAKIHESVSPLEGETIIDKHLPNSFRNTTLDVYLREIGAKRLAIAGMMTCMCVDATARAAFDLGYETILLHDAMAACDLTFGGATIPAAQVHGAFLAALGAVYGKVVGTEDYLAGMDKG